MHWLEQLTCFGHDLPLYHAERNTDIELRLSMDGQFLGTSIGRVRAFIPVTERSASRTSAILPHALSDRLQYLWGGKRTEMYLEALRRWADSEYGCQELHAVYSYIKGGSIIRDITSDGTELSGLYNSMVRFSVDGKALWEDVKLRESYISYMRSIQGALRLCHITGRMTAAAQQCPAEILGSRAKLISREEGKRIVWRGRTADSRDIFSAGYEPLFCLHRVLSRMVTEHGMRCGSRVFLSWDEDGVCHTLLPQKHRAAPCGMVTVIGLDEVTRGRVSVTFLRRLCGELFSERLSLVSIPFKRIAELAFGRKCAGGYSCDGGLLAQTVERLLGAVLDGRKVAGDIMTALRQRSSGDPEAAQALDVLSEYNRQAAERGRICAEKQIFSP